jgi:hypothetical protein
MKTSERDVMGYKAPQGPTNIGNSGPSLGGTNYGNCGSQGKMDNMVSSSGSPGLGGENMGVTGTQGKY